MEIVPDYFFDIIPSKISNYNTRKKYHCRVDLLKIDAVNQWNSSNVEARKANSINLFRKHMPNITKPLKYFFF